MKSAAHPRGAPIKRPPPCGPRCGPQRVPQTPNSSRGGRRRRNRPPSRCGTGTTPRNYGSANRAPVFDAFGFRISLRFRSCSLFGAFGASTGVEFVLFGEPSTCKVKRVVRVELRRVHLAHAAAGTRTTRPQTHENTTHYKTSHGRHRQLGRARGLDARELRRGLAGAPHSHATRPRPRSQDAHARPSQLDPT